MDNFQLNYSLSYDMVIIYSLTVTLFCEFVETCIHSMHYLVHKLVFVLVVIFGANNEIFYFAINQVSKDKCGVVIHKLYFSSYEK